MNSAILTHLVSDQDGESAVGFFPASWLIVAQGGWWKTQEILAQLPLEMPRDSAHSLLWAMVNRHHFLETRGANRDREYAVTARCRIPKGIPVGHVMAALTGKPYGSG